MPPQSPKEAVAMTDSHLDYLTTKNDQLHQYKGRTRGVLSMLATLEDDADIQLEAADLEETREAAATLEDQLDYWIETTTELRDIVQTTNAVVQTVEGMTSSLTEIDAERPERLERLQENFEGYRDWAGEEDMDLVGFEERCIDSSLRGETVTGISSYGGLRPALSGSYESM